MCGDTRLLDYHAAMLRSAMMIGSCQYRYDSIFDYNTCRIIRISRMSICVIRCYPLKFFDKPNTHKVVQSNVIRKTSYDLSHLAFCIRLAYRLLF